MVDECLSYFADSSLNVFVDGTTGAGGHAHAILSAHPEIKLYIALDRDPSALDIAKRTLKDFEGKVLFERANFNELDSVLKKHNVQTVDGFFLT